MEKRYVLSISIIYILKKIFNSYLVTLIGWDQKLLLNKIEEKMADFTQNNDQNYIDEFNIQIYDKPLVSVAAHLIHSG